MKFLLFVSVLFVYHLNAQTLLGGGCEGCEAVFEYENKVLSPLDTLTNENGDKLLVTGQILKNDGKTPAADVILYIYHTNEKGIYAKRGDEKGWGKRHGYLRGWIKTDSTGKYSFYTIKPASYPDSREPAHIHGTILEPNGYYYWIDEWHFNDDPFLKINLKEESNARGGSGIVDLIKEGNNLIAKRNIILGKNIPGYK